MSQEELETRLRDAGVADTAAWPVDATIRPVSVSDAKTIAAVERSRRTVRSLPHVSVDLRGSSGPLRSGPGPSHEVDLEVRGVIGEGGMGRVLLARQHSLERDVAVKTARDGAAESARRAILAEGVITGQLEHPAIVPVHALGVDSAGRPVMVMKRIEGVTWRTLAGDPAHEGWEGWEGTADERLPGHLQILVQICNAVHFAHSRGIVHRDIKLENVLIGRFGDVYLADWGVATPLGEQCASLAGTPGYMAPEMVDGWEVDARTDVYLLGATLHELLTGQMRHGSKSAMSAILSAKLSEPYAYPESVPIELAQLVNLACHKEPGERPPDAKAFRDALLDHVRHRESAVLAAQGVDRVEALERLLADAHPDDEQRREIDRLTAEARFGLDTALVEWPDNTAARAARERLEAILEARRAHAARLDREARERDPRVESRARAIALTALGLLSAAIATVAVVAVHVPSREELVLYPVVITALMGAGAWVQRKSVLATKFNRQIGLMLFGLMAVIMLGRGLGLFVDIDPAEHLTRDCFVLAAGLLVGGIAFQRWILVVGLVFVAGGVLIVAFPAYALPIFGVSCAVAILAAAGFQWCAS